VQQFENASTRATLLLRQALNFRWNFAMRFSVSVALLALASAVNIYRNKVDKLRHIAAHAVVSLVAGPIEVKRQAESDYIELSSMSTSHANLLLRGMWSQIILERFKRSFREIEPFHVAMKARVDFDIEDLAQATFQNESDALRVLSRSISKSTFRWLVELTDAYRNRARSVKAWSAWAIFDFHFKWSTRRLEELQKTVYEVFVFNNQSLVF
jgi:hypothetical protein